MFVRVLLLNGYAGEDRSVIGKHMTFHHHTLKIICGLFGQFDQTFDETFLHNHYWPKRHSAHYDAAEFGFTEMQHKEEQIRLD